MPQICDMGHTALLPFPKEGVLRFFSPCKIRRLRPGLNTWTWVPKASTLPLDHRSRLLACVTLIWYNWQDMVIIKDLTLHTFMVYREGRGKLHTLLTLALDRDALAALPMQKEPQKPVWTFWKRKNTLPLLEMDTWIINPIAYTLNYPFSQDTNLKST